MSTPAHANLPKAFSELAPVIEAFYNQSPITDSTHDFYKYPARFAPQFSAAANETFSSPGDVVLDPFMGGGTTIVEATRLGRCAVGGDVNALSVFLAQVKTTLLTRRQVDILQFWADGVVPSLRFGDQLVTRHGVTSDPRMRNLHLPQARFVKKLTELALRTVADLPDSATRRFARCALLGAGQWVLDGRQIRPSLVAYRERVQFAVHKMIAGLEEFAKSLEAVTPIAPRLSRSSADEIHKIPAFSSGKKAALVITSPPYPGIHILYHRWQVNGRRETPAPYWITNTRDGRGSAYYNLGDRRNRHADDYFERLAACFRSIRAAMQDRAALVQMLAFADPARHLSRYLSALEEAGFEETSPFAVTGNVGGRMWRLVPRRAWHASINASTQGSREVLLIHRAV